MCRAIRVERPGVLLGVTFFWQLWLHIGVVYGFEEERDLLNNYADALTRLALRRSL